MKKGYYVLSLDHTHPEDIFLCWYQSNGFCWTKDWIGDYTIGDIQKLNFNNGMFLLKRNVDKLWEKVKVNGELKIVILNTEKNRKKLGIKKENLKGNYKSFDISEIKKINF